MKYLNVVTFNLAGVVLAFDQDDELCAERAKLGNNVYDVLTIRTVERREMFRAIVNEFVARRIKDAFDQQLVVTRGHGQGLLGIGHVHP